MQGYVNLNPLSFDANFFFLIFKEPKSIYIGAGCRDIRFQEFYFSVLCIRSNFHQTHWTSASPLAAKNFRRRETNSIYYLVYIQDAVPHLFVFLSTIFPASVFQCNIFLLLCWMGSQFFRFNITSHSLPIHYRTGPTILFVQHRSHMGN